MEQVGSPGKQDSRRGHAVFMKVPHWASVVEQALTLCLLEAFVCSSSKQLQGNQNTETAKLWL